MTGESEAPRSALPEIDLPELEDRLGELLGELGRRLEATLPRTLALAGSAWDQVDALTVLDAPLGKEVTTLRRAAVAFAQAPLAAERARAKEAEMTLDAAVGLTSLLERRLATLVRLRLRSPSPELIPEGRPFIDVAAALAEAGRAFLASRALKETK